MTVCIIPARYGSTRFPGKLLKKLDESEVLLHTYRRAIETNAFSRVLVSAGDEQIREYCSKHGLEYIESFEEFNSGSERVIGTARKLGIKEDVVNLQADQPFIGSTELINLVKRGVELNEICTLMFPEEKAETNHGENPVFISIDLMGRIATFSRARIPSGHHTSARIIHIGVYFFPFSSWRHKNLFHVCPWVNTEKLEQLSILCSGEGIYGVIAENLWPEINTLNDLNSAKKYLGVM